MMGFQGTPARLFYDFCLEEHVPVDHMLRGIDRHLGPSRLWPLRTSWTSSAASRAAQARLLASSRERSACIHARPRCC